jgi:hypothetical protein
MFSLGRLFLHFALLRAIEVKTIAQAIELNDGDNWQVLFAAKAFRVGNRMEVLGLTFAISPLAIFGQKTPGLFAFEDYTHKQFYFSEMSFQSDVRLSKS